MKRWIVLSLALTLSAAAPAWAGEYFDRNKDDKEFGEPRDDAALVYFLRPSSGAMAVRSWAFVDDELACVSRAKGYCFVHVPPGKHMIWGKAENISTLELDLEAGQTYYVKMKILPGFGMARVRVELMEAAEAEKKLKKCGYVTITDAGRTRGAEIAATRLEKAEEKAAKRAKKSKKKNSG